ncbi:MAG: GntR family transcriptional regulator [bacterium]|nr:GntR family transcriptional regulator [bacterium]
MEINRVSYEKIKELILNMDLKPGEFISEAILAKKLNVSRTPVREALKKLEQEGLIITEGKRKRIFILTLKDLKEIFELKKIIETEVVCWAIERGKEEDFIRLKCTIEKLEGLARTRPKNSDKIKEWFELWFRQDKEFHSIIFDMADNKRARQIVENLNSQWHRLRIGIDAIEGRIEKALEEHKNIAQAILEKNINRAREAMIEHLDNLYTSVSSLMEIFHFPKS